MMHTNELGLLLSEMMNQMQNNMPGVGNVINLEVKIKNQEMAYLKAQNK